MSFLLKNKKEGAKESIRLSEGEKGRKREKNRKKSLRKLGKLLKQS